MDANQTDCGDQFATYTETESQCTPETNIMLCQLYLNKNKFF